MNDQEKLFDKWKILVLKIKSTPHIFNYDLIANPLTVKEVEEWVLETGKIEREFVQLKRQTFQFLMDKTKKR